MKSHFSLFANSNICKSLVVLSGLLFSQTSNAQKITPVVRAGFGFSDWTLSEGSSVKTGLLPAFNCGLMAEINVAQSLFVESGLEYSAVGAELKFDESDSPGYSLEYINVPVFGNLHFKNGLSIYAGPKAGLLISADEADKGEPRTDVKDAFKNADFSISGGITYTLAGGIDVGIQYTHGLTNIYNNGDTEVRNSSFGLKVGYRIPLSKS